MVQCVDIHSYNLAFAVRYLLLCFPPLLSEFRSHLLLLTYSRNCLESLVTQFTGVGDNSLFLAKIDGISSRIIHSIYSNDSLHSGKWIEASNMCTSIVV